MWFIKNFFLVFIIVFSTFSLNAQSSAEILKKKTLINTKDVVKGFNYSTGGLKNEPEHHYFEAETGFKFLEDKKILEICQVVKNEPVVLSIQPASKFDIDPYIGQKIGGCIIGINIFWDGKKLRSIFKEKDLTWICNLTAVKEISLANSDINAPNALKCIFRKPTLRYLVLSDSKIPPGVFEELKGSNVSQMTLYNLNVDHKTILEVIMTMPNLSSASIVSSGGMIDDVVYTIDEKYYKKYGHHLDGSWQAKD
jgi:hypothetical protein